MKYIKGILYSLNMMIIAMLCTFVLVGFFGSPVYAYSQNDCPLVYGLYNDDGERKGGNGNWSEVFASQELSQILPAQNIYQAIDNLRGHCCAVGKLPSDKGICKSLSTQKRWAQSVFFYDHMVDIWFRSLDGITDTNHVYPNVVVDEKAIERRDTIQKMALESKGAIPLALSTAFQQQWYDQDALGGERQPTVRIVSIDTTMNFNQALHRLGGEKYQAEMGLASKYYVACYISLFVNPTLKKNGTKRSLYPPCSRLANQRISQEATYVQVLSVEQGAQLLAQNMQTYTNEYFVQDRMMRLMDKWSNLGALMNYLTKKTQGTKECSA